MAIISERHGYLFVLAPRTASTAIGEGVLIPRLDGEWLPRDHVLDRRGRFVVQRRHSTVDQLLEHGLLTRAEVEDLFVFTTVRNPFDSLASLYYKQRYQYQPLLADPDSWVHKARGYPLQMRVAARGDFDRWLRLQVWIRRLRSAVRRDRTGRSLYAPYLRHADRVMRFETLATDLQSVLDRLGIDVPVEIPLRNPTDARAETDYRDLYSPRSRRMIERHFADDLRRFGYTF
jgi:hypothetical protein